MNIERLKTSVEVFWIRGRGTLRTVLRALGIGLVILGAFNFFTPVLAVEPLALYPRSEVWATTTTGYIAFEDLIAMATGAIVAWFV